MKREEKNRITRARILNSAVSEFARHGYEAGSLNSICEAGGVSKGIIYHYFCSKDELYLSCIGECFASLTAYLSDHLKTDMPADDRLTDYFDLRMSYFREHEEDARLFCEAVVFPPVKLKDAIAERKKPFDDLNRSVLRDILRGRRIRDDLSEEEVIRLFQRFQDFLNAADQSTFGSSIEIGRHEKECRSALNIFLYGIISRE